MREWRRWSPLCVWTAHPSERVRVRTKVSGLRADPGEARPDRGPEGAHSSRALQPPELSPTALRGQCCFARSFYKVYISVCRSHVNCPRVTAIGWWDRDLSRGSLPGSTRGRPPRGVGVLRTRGLYHHYSPADGPEVRLEEQTASPPSLASARSHVTVPCRLTPKQPPRCRLLHLPPAGPLWPPASFPLSISP